MNGQPTNAGFLALQSTYGYAAIFLGALLVWAFINLGSMVTRRIAREERRKRDELRDQLNNIR